MVKRFRQAYIYIYINYVCLCVLRREYIIMNIAYPCMKERRQAESDTVVSFFSINHV